MTDVAYDASTTLEDGKSRLHLLDLEVTRRCDLTCRTCWVVGVRPQLGDLTARRAREFMAWARLHPGAILHVSGGEPFLLPHLEEILEAGQERGFGRLVVNTNGNCLPDHRIERLTRLEIPLDIEVSVDGPRDLHESIRGPGSYDVACDSVDRLLAAGVHTAVYVTVTRPLVDRLEGWLYEMHERWPGLEVFGLMPVGDPGRGRKIARPLTRDQLESLNDIPIQALLRGIRAWLLGNPAAILPLRLNGWGRNQCYRCTGGSTRLNILADGTVTPCHPVPTPLGHVDRHTVDEVLATAPARTMARHDFDGCRDCRFRMDCGGCRAYVLADSRPFDGRDPLCESLCRGEAPPD